MEKKSKRAGNSAESAKAVVAVAAAGRADKVPDEAHNPGPRHIMPPNALKSSDRRTEAMSNLERSQAAKKAMLARWSKSGS
jgi:hypothetical protein